MYGTCGRIDNKADFDFDFWLNDEIVHSLIYSWMMAKWGQMWHCEKFTDKCNLTICLVLVSKTVGEYYADVEHFIMWFW